MEIKRIAVDTSKAVFTVHGTDLEDHAILRRHFSRPAFEAFFAKQPSTDVALEACGGSHHWGRRLTEMGHRVRLIPPQYVKPFVKRGKNDRNDAEAICEATGRPGMSTVPVRAAEHQARAMIVGVRDLLGSAAHSGDQRPARVCGRVWRDRRQGHGAGRGADGTGGLGGRGGPRGRARDADSSGRSGGAARRADCGVGPEDAASCGSR